MVGARRTAAISLVLLIACNSLVGFDELEKTSNGSRADGGSGDDDDLAADDDDDIARDGGDESAAPPRCDPTKPFGTSIVPDKLDSTAETKRAIMTRDELEIFYLRGSSAPFELRHATRPSREADWGDPTTEVLSPSATELGGVVLGGKKLYYWVVDSTGGTLTASPYASTRPKVGAGGFSPGTKLGGGTDRSIHVTEGDDGAYWAQVETIDGSINELIYRGSVQGSAIVAGDAVPNIHFFPSLDDHPALASSELVIYFASNRPDAKAQGSSDIYRASRATKAAPWSAAVNVTELNSPTLDEPSWVSDDDCVILFDRSRHINIARRPP